MDIIDCQQGSEEWYLARLGVVTASEFKAVMTKPKSGSDISQTALSYMIRLASERLTGDRREISCKYFEWGHQWEEQAIKEYSFLTDNKVNAMGFVKYNKDIGASPDGLIELDGGIEVKCPENPKNHLMTVYKDEIPKEHIPQIQGNMWVCERKWWDFISFDPRLQNKSRVFIKRVKRDEDYICELIKKNLDFVERLYHMVNSFK